MANSLLDTIKNLVPKSGKEEPAPPPSSNSDPQPVAPAPITQPQPVPQSYAEARPVSNTEPTPPPPDTAKKRSELKGIRKWLSDLNLYVRGCIFAVALLGIIIAVIAIAMIINLDTSVVKLRLSGLVVSEAGAPIQGATVEMAALTLTTDAQGRFSVEGLEMQTYPITISAVGYADYSGEVEISRTFLDYTTDRTFVLTGLMQATITGQVVVDDSSYQFFDDRIMIGEQEFPINPDGTFSISTEIGGEVELHYRSAQYADQVRSLTLEGTNIDLGDIPTSPAGDIIAPLRSFLTDQLVLDVSVTVEGVPPEQVEISSSGELRVRDLEVGREYQIRVQHPDYVNRDYLVTVDSGNNQIFGFSLVEDTRIPILREIDDDFQLFSINLDGSDPIQLTNEDRSEPYGEYLYQDGIYYLSTRDRVRATTGGEAPLVYAVGTTGGNPQRITQDTEALGRILPNFNAQLLVNVTGVETVRVLEVMDLTGSDRTELYRTPAGGTVVDVVVADNGSRLVFNTLDIDEQTDGTYQVDLASGEVQKLFTKRNTLLYDISADGDRVLYTAENPNTGLQDLQLFTISTGQDTRLRQSYTGSSYQFMQDSNDTLLFFDLRDGGSNMYVLDIGDNSEQKITNFSGVEGIEAVYQQPNLILYQTNQGLYVMDPDSLVPDKFVTANVARYTGYDF